MWAKVSKPRKNIEKRHIESNKAKERHQADIPKTPKQAKEIEIN